MHLVELAAHDEPNAIDVDLPCGHSVAVRIPAELNLAPAIRAAVDAIDIIEREARRGESICGVCAANRPLPATDGLSVFPSLHGLQADPEASVALTRSGAVWLHYYGAARSLGFSEAVAQRQAAVMAARLVRP